MRVPRVEASVVGFPDLKQLALKSQKSKELSDGLLCHFEWSVYFRRAVPSGLSHQLCWVMILAWVAQIVHTIEVEEITLGFFIALNFVF
ncbi:hypothetical protein [Nostoc sp.]|uniref:hypothetical protein n=1 Tax=Nostoc sp. TaxID=1180 RepID=UPI002FF8C880